MATALILLAAIWLRFRHVDWDQGHLLHPDERGLLFVAQGLSLPSSATALWDVTHSPLNPLRLPDGSPSYFAYGHLPLYLAAALQHVIVADDRLIRLALTSRILSAFFDVLTVLGAYRLAKDIDGRPAGILGATFLATAIAHIQSAHFGTVDTTLSCFCTYCIWFVVRFLHTGRQGYISAAGILAGLAIGTKATALLLIVPLLFTVVRQQHRLIAICLKLLSLVAISFGLSNPYALLDFTVYVTALSTQQAMVSGTLPVAFTYQFTDTVPVFYTIRQHAWWLLGPILTFSGYAGLVRWVAEGVKSHSHFVGALWVVVTLIATTGQFAKFPRYTLMFTPVLCASAAGFLIYVAQRKWLRRSGTLLVAIAVITSLTYACAFDRMYLQPHPWLAASRWIYATYQSPIRLTTESGDETLPIPMEIDGTLMIREQLYLHRTLDVAHRPEDTEKLRQFSTILSETDLLVLASARHYGMVLRLADRFPISAAYYRALFTGDLGFEVQSTFSRHPSAFGVAWQDDPFAGSGIEIPAQLLTLPKLPLGAADESFTLYDHPTVIVFTNANHLPVERIRAAIIDHLRY